MSNHIIRPQKKQREAFKMLMQKDILFVLFGGAIRGGKSYWAFLASITLGFMYPNARIFLVRKSLNRILDATKPSFDQFINGNHLRQSITPLTKTRYIFDNGSELIFLAESFQSDKELNKFRGLEANFFVLEEMNELQLLTFQKCIERAGTWFHAEGNPKPKILGTCNPTKGWLKSHIYDAYKNGTLNSKFKYIPSYITDNEYIPEGYLENLKATMTSEMFEMFVLGDWDIDNDSLVQKADFTIKTQSELVKEGVWLGLTWHCYIDGAYTDSTKNDPTGIVYAAAYEGNTYIRFAHSKHINSSDIIPYIQKEFNQLGKTGKSLVKIEPKASGKTLVQIARKTSGEDFLNAVEYKFPKASKLTVNNSKIEKLNAVLAYIKSGRCILVEGSWTDNFISEFTKFPDGEHDDMLDAGVMAMVDSLFGGSGFSATFN